MWAFAAALLSVSASAPAQRLPTPGAKPAAAAHTAPLPQVHLSIDAPAAAGPWTMRVTNAGEVPVRIVADARLLTLDVTPRGASKPVRCELPADMRPGDDLERPLVLPPKRSYVETFEPRLYCFGAKKLDALAPQAIVAAHLGWPGRGERPPFEVSPIDGVEPALAPLRAIDAAPIALPDEPTAAPAPTLPHRDPDPPRLSLTGSVAVDAESVAGTAVVVTVRNEGSRAAVVRFQPATLGFDVSGEKGVERCGWPTLPSAPTREQFMTVRPGAEASLSLVLADYCAGHALDHAGLFVVRPWLDTRKASGADIGVRSFDDELVATKPTLVRLHKGTAPPKLVRPRLEP
jgi:hypothetical protein